MPTCGTGWYNHFKYSYTGNKLNAVSDIGTANRDNSFIYDANGNATKNDRLEITDIAYNYLNLPKKFVQGSHQLVYLYDATGRKLKKTLGSAVTDYVEGIQYKNGVLEFIQTEEGRILPSGSSFIYEYFLTDHLGNTRAIVDHTGSVKQIQDYYAFGMEMNTGSGLNSASNHYKYNGKEKQVELGLDQLDYGARFYDAEIGRWNVVDPLAEQMRSYSPYGYAFNNPLKFIDLAGMIPYPITIRSSAPFKTFGGGFHGDGRGYSNVRSYSDDRGPTARVHQVINFDTDKSKITAETWSSPTSHGFMPGSLRETPSIEFSSKFRAKSSGDSKTFMFGTHSKGANPMIPGSPNIDVFSEFSITENKKAGTLDIRGKLTGDNFPSTEAFISDPSGNNVFIGIGFYEGSPFSSLAGENKRPITEFNFT